MTEVMQWHPSFLCHDQVAYKDTCDADSGEQSRKISKQSEE